MSLNSRQNRKREPRPKLDKQGVKNLVLFILKIALTCALAIGIPYGIYMYYQHQVSLGYFVPHAISIHGNVRLDDKAILDASGLQMEGVNLFEADVRTIASSIETLPWVKNATVKIDLPDAVDITVEEHEALGIVNDGQLYVVNPAGQVIKPWAPEDLLMAPIVSTSRAVDTQAAEIVRAFELAQNVAKRGFPHKIQEVHYDNATGYTLFTETSEIRLGYDRFDERISRLLVIDDELARRHVAAAYILLDGDSSLDRIVVKPLLKETKSETASTEATGTAKTDETKHGDAT